MSENITEFASKLEGVLQCASDIPDSYSANLPVLFLMSLCYQAQNIMDRVKDITIKRKEKVD